MRTTASAAAERPGRRAAALAAALCLLGAGPALAQTSDLVNRSALRVCADPANLPFSNEKGEGFENKIAELLAKDLGVPLEYTWYPMATGFYRNTLGAMRCDVVMGYVAGADPVQNTNPYYRSSWILVFKKGGGLEGVDRLSDPRLQGKHIGVVAGTAPATVMAMNGLMGTARPYALMVDRRFESPNEKMVADIASGEIDAGLLWGPIAGYFVRQAGVPLESVPLVHENGPMPMAYRITFGVRPNEPNWRHRLNDFIAQHQAELNKILSDYGVPLLDERDRPISTASPG